MMKKELELKIAEEFPFMNRGKNIDEQRKEDGRISDLYGTFGCSISDGWFEVIRGLCRDASGFVRVFRKWTNPLAKFIGDQKVLEVMAGNGMLAYTLKQRGIDIIATDNIAWKRFCTKNLWPIGLLIKVTDGYLMKPACLRQQIQGRDGRR